MKILVIQLEVEFGGGGKEENSPWEGRCTRTITLEYFVTADNWTCPLIPSALPSSGRISRFRDGLVIDRRHAPCFVPYIPWLAFLLAHYSDPSFWQGPGLHRKRQTPALFLPLMRRANTMLNCAFVNRNYTANERFDSRWCSVQFHRAVL